MEHALRYIVAKPFGFKRREGKSLYFKWGELHWKWGFALTYSVYHESAHAHLNLGPVSIFINAPMVLNQDSHTEDWNASYGFTYFERAVQFHWRCHCKIIHMPWDWRYAGRNFYWPDGSLFCTEREWVKQGNKSYVPPKVITQTLPFTYKTDKETQTGTATIHGEEHFWQWRWLPFVRMSRRSIDIRFSREVGKRAGSWKGGIISTGARWSKGESQQAAFARFMANPNL